jgi:transcriptional antiterminator RfaH
MRNWHLLYTKPHKEPLVHAQLDDRGYEVFFPYVQRDRGYNRGVRLEPIFPQYLFVNVDLISAEANGLRSLPGMRTIVDFGGQPAVIPDAVVHDLRGRLETYGDKILRKSESLFTPGQHVEVTDGPFIGFDAVYQRSLSGGQRVQILLDMMGSWTRMQLSVDRIKAVDRH